MLTASKYTNWGEHLIIWITVESVICLITVKYNYVVYVKSIEYSISTTIKKKNHIV